MRSDEDYCDKAGRVAIEVVAAGLGHGRRFHVVT